MEGSLKTQVPGPHPRDLNPAHPVVRPGDGTLKKINLLILAVPGLHCIVWDLQLWHVGSLFLARDQTWALHWECRFSATGPPRCPRARQPAPQILMWIVPEDRNSSRVHVGSPSPSLTPTTALAHLGTLQTLCPSCFGSRGIISPEEGLPVHIRT